jgi:hypothetical protein
MANESQGTVIYWSSAGSTSASTAAANAIGEVVGFNGPSGQAGTIDVTHLGSTAKEFMMGLRDEGEVSLDINFVPGDGGQVRLRTDRANRSLKKCVIKLNDNATDAATTKLTFDAYCIGLTAQGSVDNALKGTATIKISGAVTYSSAIV